MRLLFRYLLLHGGNDINVISVISVITVIGVIVISVITMVAITLVAVIGVITAAVFPRTPAGRGCSRAVFFPRGCQPGWAQT